MAAEAFAEMEADTQIEILEHMNSQQASDLLEEMPPDEAADLLGELPEEKSDELLNLMEPEEAQEVRELMDYEEGTAGALMTTEYIALSPEITVGRGLSGNCAGWRPRRRPSITFILVEEDEILIGGRVPAGTAHGRTGRHARRI